MGLARKTLGYGPLRTLAVLLLMNGQPVSKLDIAAALGLKGQVIGVHLATLKEHGVWQIATSHRKHRLHRRYRLVSVPPDEVLDRLLVEVDALKRSAWWADMSAPAKRHTA